MTISSNLHRLLTAAALAALAVANVACFGADPNKNSMTISGSGGSTGTGGSGSGGSGSVDPNGAIVGSPLATFNTSGEGFTLNAYHDTGQVNLGDPASGATPMLSVDATAGSPTPGSLKIVAPYSGANQYVDIQKSYGTTSPQDWSNRTLHVRIRVTEGTFGGGAQLYAITTAGYVFGGTFTNIAKNANWQEFRLNVSMPMTMNAGYDPTKVVVFGVQINTGSAGAGAMPVTFNIDSFSIDPPLAGGGTDGSGGTGGSGGGGGGGGTGTDASLTDATTVNDATSN